MIVTWGTIWEELVRAKSSEEVIFKLDLSEEEESAGSRSGEEYSKQKIKKV